VLVRARWTEVEVDAGNRQFVRRRHSFGKSRVVSTLSFAQVKAVRAGVEAPLTAG